MEPNFGWLPRERGIEEESRRSSGAGPAASHHSPLDIQAFLLHTVPCTIQTLRFPFSPKKQSGGWGGWAVRKREKKNKAMDLRRCVPCSLGEKDGRVSGRWGATLVGRVSQY